MNRSNGARRRTGATRRLPRAATIATLLLASAAAPAFETRGHLKLQTSAIDLPRDSLFADISADPARDHGFDLRVNLGGGDDWRFQVDYQLLHRDDDLGGLGTLAPTLAAEPAPLPDDSRRVLDLTHVISDAGGRATAHRLDRFYLARAADGLVFKLGRQAISWGNGVVYNPMDFFNPFDPAAIDREYKTGDDMLYLQFGRDNGDDLQLAWVGRRDADGDVETGVSSLALKYHGFAGAAEYDLLVAEHFDARIVGLGLIRDFAGVLWRADVVRSDDEGEAFTSAVLNASYAWTPLGRNVAASLELHRNGFGIVDGDYAPAALASRPELVERIARGELFTLGRHYLGAVATLELTPLWLLGVNLFANLDDDSRLLQITSRHDLAQDQQLVIVVGEPSGRAGSEFGGIAAATPGRTLALGRSLFAQFAWYF